ncbi:MAG TPA: hypothetical protein EYP87_08095 [Flavobacteriaceae bacterium]|nr:hypothetical protein [Flavobacteriaceae bacterium]
MRVFLVLLTFLLLLSCKNDSDNEIKKVESNITKTSINNEDEKFTIQAKKVILHSEAKKAIENWQEYISVSDFISKFYNTSTKEVLLNSAQFYELTSHLKDSIRLDRFKKPSLKIRLNVLNNEALRLFDMDSIPSITNKEVIHETENIINAYNALNIKINNSVKRDLLSNDLSGFNHLFETKDSLDIKPLNKQQQKLKKEKRKKIINKKRINPLSIRE